MKEETKILIRNHISIKMEKLMNRRILEEPFNEDEIARRNPFGFRLVPTEIWKSSKFERSFVTSLGQGIFEQIAKIIAEETGALVKNQYDKTFTITTWQNEKIEEVLMLQRSSKLNPDWENEILEIEGLLNRSFMELTVKFDLYVRRIDGKEEFYSLKAVKPNLDQTERAKRDMLRMMAENNDNEVFLAIPFNPSGEESSYKLSGHSIPYRLFDMDNDKCVLIGSQFWNKLGQNENTYNELLEIFSEVGEQYRELIRKEYLKI